MFEIKNHLSIDRLNVCFVYLFRSINTSNKIGHKKGEITIILHLKTIMPGYDFVDLVFEEKCATVTKT